MVNIIPLDPMSTNNGFIVKAKEVSHDSKLDRMVNKDLKKMGRYCSTTTTTTPSVGPAFAGSGEIQL